MEEMKNILAKEGRLKRYRNKIKQHKLKIIFQNDERKSYQQAREENINTNEEPNAKETKLF